MLGSGLRGRTGPAGAGGQGSRCPGHCEEGPGARGAGGQDWTRRSRMGQGRGPGSGLWGRTGPRGAGGQGTGLDPERQDGTGQGAVEGAVGQDWTQRSRGTGELGSRRK